MVLAAIAACEPIEENEPELSGFSGRRPSAQGTTTDGGSIDEGTFCNGDPIAAVDDCSVSFAESIYPIISTGPSSCGAPGCHATASDNVPNPLADPDPKVVWRLLVDYKFQDRAGGPLPYVNICSNDPEQSAITCNLDFDAPCGVAMPENVPLASAEMAAIRTWLECGAPNN